MSLSLYWKKVIVSKPKGLCDTKPYKLENGFIDFNFWEISAKQQNLFSKIEDYSGDGDDRRGAQCWNPRAYSAVLKVLF